MVNTTTCPSPPSNNSLVAAVVVGGSIGASALLVTKRAVLTQFKQLEHNLRRTIQQDIAVEVNQGLSRTSSQFATSLQSQERELTKSFGLPVAAARQELSSINRQLQDFTNIFANPGSRGALGEFQLEQLVKDVMPPNSYSFQQRLSNSKRVDCLLHLPSPVGKVAVDSKFPLISNSLAKEQRSKTLRDSLTKHVGDISSKYIIAGETAEYAILFLPSEGLFLEIVQDHPEIVSLAYKQKVWLACPTTLMAVLTTLQGATKGMALQEHTDSVFSVVDKLTCNVDLLVERFEKAEKSLERTKKELSNMQVSIGKIRKASAELDVLNGSGVLGNAKKTPAKSLKSNQTNDATVATAATKTESTTSAKLSNIPSPATVNGGTNGNSRINDISRELVGARK